LLTTKPYLGVEKSRPKNSPQHHEIKSPEIFFRVVNREIWQFSPFIPPHADHAFQKLLPAAAPFTKSEIYIRPEISIFRRYPHDSGKTPIYDVRERKD
jgi:hypothetical protein